MNVNAYRCTNYEIIRRIRILFAKEIEECHVPSNGMFEPSLPDDIDEQLEAILSGDSVEQQEFQDLLSEYVDDEGADALASELTDFEWCDFSMKPSAGGGYQYVTNDEGKRIEALHPNEYQTIQDVLGPDPSETEIDNRTGFISFCVCQDCLTRCELDLEADTRQCPKCGSGQVASATELVDDQCPKCDTGMIKEIMTGVVS